MSYGAWNVQVRWIVAGLGINVIFFCRRALVSFIMVQFEVSLVSWEF